MVLVYTGTMEKTGHSDLIKRLETFAMEAYKDNKAFSRVGQDDNSYDALALGDIAMAMVEGLKNGTTPKNYATYAGPSPDGMDDLLEVPLTPEVAEKWLKMAEEARTNIG